MSNNEEVPKEHTGVVHTEISEIDHDLEITNEEVESKRKHPEHPRALVVVENGDSGETIRLWTPLSETIGELIAEVYRKFRLAQQVGDRLFRISDGVSIFGQEALTVKDYLEAQHGEPSLHWKLLTDTGGACRS